MPFPSGLLSPEIGRRYVKRFMDIVVLAMLKQTPMHGYDLIAAIHDRFHILVGPGALYPVLHSLEKEGLITGQLSGSRRRTVYNLTDRGRGFLERQLRELVKVQDLYSRILQGMAMERPQIGLPQTEEPRIRVVGS
ncbi:MAG: PadR family transcriptional regulator [Candidatus Bathyarchaeia archaeon]